MKKQQNKYQPVFYTVWQDAWVAITKPQAYVKWAVQPAWRSVKYLIILLLVASIVATIFVYMKSKPGVEEFKTWAQENLPVITYTNGILSIEDDEIFTFTDSDEFYIKIDATQSFKDEPITDTFYNFGFVILKDGVVYGGQGDYETISYKEFGIKDFDLTKEEIAPLTDKLVRSVLILIPFLVFTYLLISKLIYTLLFAFIMWLFSRQYPFKDFWNMALYALTPAMLIGYISFIFGVAPGVYSLVFVIYYLMAIHYYRQSKQKI